MNREIVYKFEVDRPRELTKEEAADMDRAQSWRRRISSGAMEDLNALAVLTLWARKIVEKPQMRDLLRDMGVYRRAKSAVGLMKSAAEGAFANVSAAQLRTMDANWQTMNITLSSTKLVKGFANVDADVLNVLLRQTMVSCKEKFCMESEQASRKCPVRQALDNCLNAGRFAENYEKYLGLCPYCLNNLEEV